MVLRTEAEFGTVLSAQLWAPLASAAVVHLSSDLAKQLPGWSFLWETQTWLLLWWHRGEQAAVVGSSVTAQGRVSALPYPTLQTRHSTYTFFSVYKIKYKLGAKFSKECLSSLCGERTTVYCLVCSTLELYLLIIMTSANVDRVFRAPTDFILMLTLRSPFHR